MKNFHNSVFRKYYEGYTDVAKVKPDGKTYTEYVYTDYYYKQAYSERRWKIQKWMFALMTALSDASVIYSGCQKVPSNLAWYVTLFTGLTFVSLCMTTITACRYLLAGRDMTVGEYKESSRALIFRSRLAAVLFAAASLSELTYALIHFDSYIWRELLCGLTFLVGGGCMFAVFMIERKTEYSKTPSQIEEFESVSLDII